MAIEMKVENNNMAVFHVSGKFGKDEHQQILLEIEALTQKIGQIRVLVLLNYFAGWEKAEGWEDTSVSDRIDPYISKLAFVGDEKWRDLVLLFSLKGLRPVAIEYFDADQEVTARQWLKI